MVHDISLIRQRYASEVLPPSLLLNDSGIAPNSDIPNALCKHRHESCQYNNKCEGRVPLSKEVVHHLSNPHEHPTSITHANTHTHTHTHTHIHMHTHTHMHAHSHAHTHTCMHTHMHAHTHARTHTHMLRINDIDLTTISSLFFVHSGHLE